MTSFGAALSSLTQEAYKPRLTDFGGGKNAKSLYGLSPRCNDLTGARQGVGNCLLHIEWRNLIVELPL